MSKQAGRGILGAFAAVERAIWRAFVLADPWMPSPLATVVGYLIGVWLVLTGRGCW